MKMTVNEHRFGKMAAYLQRQAVQLGMTSWDAEDLVQETFSVFFRNWYRYRRMSRDQREKNLQRIFRAEYVRRMHTVGMNCEEPVKDPEFFLRSSESPPKGFSVEEYAESNQNLRIILKELFRLKKNMRDVLEVAVFTDVPAEEAGKLLGLTEKAYLRRLDRARGELRLRLLARGIEA